MNLSQIGDKHGTRKNTHVTNGKTLLDLYEPYLEPLKDKKINLLEIGVLDGSSIKTWEEYFSIASIFAIDIQPACKKYESKRTSIEIGSQADETVLNKIIEKANKNFDVIIDDGSHINTLTLKSFEYLYKYLNKGGIYILEDMLCTYSPALKQWPGMTLNTPDNRFNNDRNLINNKLLEIIKQMDTNDNYDLFSIHIYRNTYILIKK